MTARDLVERLEVRERLQAVIHELDRLDADADVPRTLAEGLFEDINAVLADRVDSQYFRSKGDAE